MNTVHEDKNWQHVLVFLPHKTAQYISSRLEEQGYRATVVHTRQSALEVLMTNAPAVAVTLRADIDTIRNITPIPVVNLEVFFQSGPSVEDVLNSTRKFDGRAFLKRIAALTEIKVADRRLSAA